LARCLLLGFKLLNALPQPPQKRSEREVFASIQLRVAAVECCSPIGSSETGRAIIGE